jgi:hypothetical protein
MNPRRHSVVPAVLIAGALLALLFALTTGSKHTVVAPRVVTTSTVPVKLGGTPPPVLSAPGCTPAQQAQVASGHGKLGVCAPRPLPGFRLSLPFGTERGPDTSNNDPLYDWQPVKARGSAFGWAKISQGTGFTDQTAIRQIHAIRAAKLAPGGYDFYEVCVGSGRAEADFYLLRLHRTGAEGPGSLPAAGDAEWPLSPPCSAGGARRWIAEWVSTVYRTTHRLVVLYTGAWWWNPNVGCWWPAHALAWISGYGVSFPALPCGRSELDFWQFSSTFPITSTFAGDMSVYRRSTASWRALIGAKPVETPAHRRRREHAHLKALDRELPKIRRHLLNSGCRVARPRRACQPLFRRGAAVKREIAVLHARLYPHH